MNKNLNKAFIITCILTTLCTSGCANKEKNVDIMSTNEPTETTEYTDPNQLLKETAQAKETNIINALSNVIEEDSPFYAMINEFLSNHSEYKILNEDNFNVLYSFSEENDIHGISLISSEENCNRIFLLNNVMPSSVYELINQAYNDTIQSYTDEQDIQFEYSDLSNVNEEGYVDGISVLVIGNTQFIQENASLLGYSEIVIDEPVEEISVQEKNDTGENIESTVTPELETSEGD